MAEKVTIIDIQDQNHPYHPGGGGGGALGFLGGRIRSLSELKNTPKALSFGQKSTLTFPLNKHPFFYQNTDIG